MGGNPIQFDFSVLFTAMIPMLFSLIFFVFIIYFMINALHFFKHKEKTDHELLQKLDTLIKLQAREAENKS